MGGHFVLGFAPAQISARVKFCASSAEVLWMRLNQGPLYVSCSPCHSSVDYGNTHNRSAKERRLPPPPAKKKREKKKKTKKEEKQNKNNNNHTHTKTKQTNNNNNNKTKQQQQNTHTKTKNKTKQQNHTWKLVKRVSLESVETGCYTDYKFIIIIITIF